MGEGQIPVVRDQELAAIEKVFEQAGMKEVKFAFIIVSKRIKTKFFRDKENPHSGTIVDDVVTLNERLVVSIVPRLAMFFSRYDFFLVSQSVRQGTINPTNYNVIRETTGRETVLSGPSLSGCCLGLTPTQMQALTYKLTHLYYNWPGTVRVPAVCQYAHKVSLSLSVIPL